MSKSPGTGGGSRGREARGRQYGNTRGKERQRRRADNRLLDPRYQAAMDETHRQQEELDRLIEEQKKNPAVGAVEGALIDAQIKERQQKLEAAQAAEEFARECSEVEESVTVPEKLVPDTVIAPAPLNLKYEYVEINGKSKSITSLPYTAAPLRKIDKKKLPKSGDGNFQFSTTTARLMLKQGYNIKYVLEFTGVGYEDVSDLDIDEEGYGLREEAHEEDFSSGDN